MAKSLSPLQRAYNALKRKKSEYCKGKATKSDVDSVAKTYVAKAVAKGQTKVEAEKKANAVKKSGCKMSSVAGTRKRKKKTTTRRRKK